MPPCVRSACRTGHTEIILLTSVTGSGAPGARYVPFTRLVTRGMMRRHAPEATTHPGVKRGVTGMHHDAGIIPGTAAMELDRELADEKRSPSLTGTNGQLPAPRRCEHAAGSL